MEKSKPEPIFVNGYITRDIPDTTPDYVLGKGSFQVDSLIEFLNANKKFAVKGYLNFETLRSKATSKRYTKLDLYEYEKNQFESTLSPAEKEELVAAREAEKARKAETLQADTESEIPF
jgi:hypothetical protein